MRFAEEVRLSRGQGAMLFTERKGGGGTKKAIQQRERKRRQTKRLQTSTLCTKINLHNYIIAHINTYTHKYTCKTTVELYIYMQKGKPKLAHIPNANTGLSNTYPFL